MRSICPHCLVSLEIQFNPDKTGCRIFELNDQRIPIIRAIRRKDYPWGLQFFCPFCKKNHLHGSGEGHRAAHCTSSKSPYLETGYILKLEESDNSKL